MTRSRENLRRALVALFVLTAGAISTLASTPARSAPAAGTVIGNQATATYNDASGTPRTATSNMVQTTVSQVKSFQLAANGSRTAAPGQTVYYPHTITNTGNGTDTYTLNPPTSTNFAAAGAGHASLAYYIDANGDGVPDNATPINTSGAIPAGGVFRFVVAGTVPAAAASGNTADLVVSVTDTTPATQTNTDTTTVASSVIIVTKALSSNSGPGGVTVTVTLSYANSGTATANNVQITDTLPAGMTYVIGQSRWSVSGGAVLTEANDGVEQGGFPPGIDFRQAGGVVTALIPSVAAGVSGNVTFQVTIGNVPPQNIGNTAQYTTQAQPTPVNTNTATYQVLQTASVVANGASANSTNGTGEPVTVASAAAGSTVTFDNFIWNLGNGTDTFDITIQSDNFPAGHSVLLLQQDGATTLLNSAGTAAPDTGPIPGRNQPCAAPLVTDGTFCGYKVVVRVTLPANAANGVYSITKRATSVFNTAVFDDVTDTLSAVAANSVDVTNDRAAPPAGTAVAADGLGAGAGAVIRTMVVTPAAATPTATRFQVWITNTGAVSDSFNLTATFAATSAAGVVPPVLPAGWSVAFLGDGGAANCSTVGAPLVSTGPLASNAARLVCAQVTSPPVAGGVIAGDYDFDFRATSATNVALSDAVRDRVTIVPVVVLPPPGSFSAKLAADTFQSVLPGATVFVPHTLTNTGTTADTYTITATDLTQGYAFTSVTLYPDANGDGVPDGAVPLANPIALGPGQVLRFVAQIVVPANAPSRAVDAVRLSAVSVGAATITPISDVVSIIATAPADCGLVGKVLSQNRGTSPGGPVTISLAYSSCDKPRSRLTITDVLPVGMRYVAGSGRWSVIGNAALSDAVVGTDREGTGAMTIAYDFNVTEPNAVTASLFDIPAQTSGTVTFAVEVISGLAIGTEIRNTAAYGFYDTSGVFGGRLPTNTASYFVLGSVDLELTGQRLPTAVPGTTADFLNVLTNRGSATDTFDITVAGSTFPAGTTFALFKGDGVTPLADTDGNGVPDTGPVAPGASFNIVLRARIPATAAPGAYKVNKVARSVNSAMRTATAEDAVDTLSKRCVVAFDPDQQSRIGRGQHVTYSHLLSNRGNCVETVQAMLDYLGDSKAGWTSAAYVDGNAAGGASIPGVLDAADTPIVRGWSAVLQPGESIRILVDVRSPSAKSLAKAVVDSDVTTLVIMNAASGALTVKDTTTVDDLDEPAEPQNAIRNFTDSTYAAPTPWGVVGGQLWLRANAQACNAAPDAVDTRTVVITGPNGEREEVTAVETGVNTGVFVVPMIPIHAPPVTAGNGILEGRANDVFTVEMLGCGRRIDTLVTVMEPVSVVFDSRTNEPVAGARVTLTQASGGQCLAGAATFSGSSSNPVVTGADGRFAFPPAAGSDFCLAVTPPNGYRFASRVAWPLLPQGRNLNVTGLTSGGSYGNAFHLAASGLVVVDIPLDAIAQAGLFVQKETSRTIAEIGDFVDYTVRVKNGTGNVLDRAEVMLGDDLPAGFAYVSGSARRGAVKIADPLGGHGPRLTFNVGHMDRDEEAAVSYRVRIGAGALQGDGTNRVQATYTAGGLTSSSNVAIARVSVTGGVFTDKGFILGKVFMDCNANGVQDAGERGVPGVRLVMEDGTFVITDGGGKFSFYGVSNRTHVVKADRTTLPAGATLAAISSRNLGDGGSRIVDLKAGELHRADFAIAGCEAAVVEEVKARAEALARRTDELALAATQLTTEARVITDLKSLPASGVVSAASPPGAPASTLPGAPAGEAATKGAAAKSASPAQAGAASDPGPSPSRAPGMTIALETLVPDLDDTVGFIGLADGDTLPSAQSAVRVKGTAGAALALSVNGVAVPPSRIGKRSVLEEKHVQAWEYIGVDLEPGENTLLVVQSDAFGNERGRKAIRVNAPGRLARIDVELPAEAVADGRSAAKVIVKLRDARGVAVATRTPVTLEATRGAWDAQDIDPTEPGLQAMVEGGEAVFSLIAPTEPGQARIVVTSGKVKSEAKLDFLPELRSLIAAGVVEGVINLRRIDTRALVPARTQDNFEQELLHLSRTSGDGKREAGVRAAFFLKGKIRGDYLLTAAYDSDKDTRERLFRDIQPDEFYPVYGDSAVRGYDAQSTARLYLRVDSRKSYLLYGDFNTLGDANVRRLSAYSRSLTGVKEHYENGRVQANFFASRDSTRQKIEEVRANGTSGPYMLSSPTGLVNSEKVEILTRDRNRPALILATSAQARFYDYEMEPLTGRILFKAPVPSVDQELNPISIRITYEVDQGGPEFWVFGGDADVKVTDRITVGASFAEDRNPSDPFKLRGAHAIVRLGERTTVAAEYAHTERPATVGQGDAGRIHFKHDGERLKAEAFVARTDPTFDNPGAYLGQGRGEAGARLSYKLGEETTLKAEALRTEDTLNHNLRDGYMAGIERTFAKHLKLELSLRHARETGGPAIPASLAGPGSVGTTPNEVTSVRARMTGPVPGVKDATVYGEVEVDTQDAQRKVVAVGGEYTLPNKGKIYLRHEFISSLTGPYGLNEQQRQNATVLGVDTEYMKDARLFSEYRIHDAISGGDAEAAIGLRNLWTLAPGWRLGTTLERVHALSGSGQNENSAIALGLEYTGSALWKGSTRLELRDASTQQSLLHTLGFASRISREWTFLGRNTFSVQRTKGGELDGTEHVIERLQAGVAFRDADTDKVNALARVEHREERDNTQAGIDLRRTSEILSIHADYKLSRPFLVTGHYAAKWTHEASGGIATRYRAQLLSGRLTWEFAPRWDVGLAASGLFGERLGSRQYALGLEVGYRLATNLWLSAGYNVFGYHDDDLAAGDYTNKGAYLRLRYKFDESLLGSMGEGSR